MELLAGAGHSIYVKKSTTTVAIPVPTMAERARLSMRSNKSKNTTPEVRLRQALRSEGLIGYRLHKTDLPGKPDICFTRQKIAVFVHGCYWHRCPNCRLPDPKTNATYWLPKLQRNVERDKEQALALEVAGWKVLVVWECELKISVEQCVSRIAIVHAQGEKLVA